MADDPADGPTFVQPRPCPAPVLRIFLLHHAGGSHLVFRPWLPLLPTQWDVRLVAAPGRFRDTADLTALAERFLDRMGDLPDLPYVLFGHSMGALTAFAVGLVASARGSTPPEWIGVSGHPGPDDQPVALGGRRLHELRADELRAALAELGGLPERLLHDDIMWRRLEPVVRADLRAVETWRPPARPRTVPCAMSAFRGDSDPVTSATPRLRWSRYSSRFLGVRRFPGGHFYFQPDPTPLVRQIIVDVRLAVAAGARRDPAPTGS
ncbi:MAG TPA: alpha/beta fold hydrolase [Micromonosporaceae bacterium]